MNTIAKLPGILLKAAAIFGLGYAAFCYLSLFVHWAARRSYIGPYDIAFVVTSILIAFASASGVVVVLNRKNSWRVVTNTSLLSSPASPWDDPLSRGSYDHGGAETEQGWLIFGTLGTLVGYILTLLRETKSTNKSRSRGESPLGGARTSAATRRIVGAAMMLSRLILLLLAISVLFSGCGTGTVMDI